MEKMIETLLSLVNKNNNNITQLFIQLFGQTQFLQKIEKQETTNPKTKETTIDFIENPDTGGEFVIYNKNNNIQETNKLGTLYLYQGKLYIVNNNDTENIRLLNTNTFEDLENLKNIRYLLYR